MKFAPFHSCSKPSTVKPSCVCHSANPFFLLSVPHLIPISFSNKPSAPSLSPSELITTTVQSRSDRPDCTSGLEKSQKQLLPLTLSLFALAYIQNVSLFCRGGKRPLTLCHADVQEAAEGLQPRDGTCELAQWQCSSSQSLPAAETSFPLEIWTVSNSQSVSALKTQLECADCPVQNINKRLRIEKSYLIDKNGDLSSKMYIFTCATCGKILSHIAEA